MEPQERPRKHPIHRGGKQKRQAFGPDALQLLDEGFGDSHLGFKSNRCITPVKNFDAGLEKLAVARDGPKNWSSMLALGVEIPPLRPER